MFNICIIGFGNIGKRHFEALLKININANVYLIDVYELAFNNINSYNIGSNFNVKYSCDYRFLPSELDLAIIATSSDIRRDCFEKLVNSCKVRNIIFEKVLFQKVEDYNYVENELNIRGIHAWVNCARREMASYIKLKEELFGKQINNITISGGNWGLGCNGIHMLDLISYLLSDKELVIDSFAIDDLVIDSKRKGFKEIFGKIYGKSKNDDCNFEISCNNTDDSALISVETNNLIYKIYESDGMITRIDLNKSKVESEFLIDYVSSTSKNAISSILLNANCKLTTFKKSSELHLLFIKYIIEFFEKRGGEKGICPIT